MPPLPILIAAVNTQKFRDGLLLPHCHLTTKPYHGDGDDHGSILFLVVNIGGLISLLQKIFRNAFKIFWVTECLPVTKSSTEYFFHYITCFGDDKVKFLKNLTRNIVIFRFLGNDKELQCTITTHQLFPQ